MFITAVGQSNNVVEPKAAVEEIIEKCNLELERHSLKAKHIKGGLFWASMVDYNFFETILKKIKEEYINISLIGCTTDGEIGCLKQYENSFVLVVFATQDDSLKIVSGYAKIYSENFEKTIDNVINRLKDKINDTDLFKKSFCFTFPNGIASFKVPVLNCLQKYYENPILGALSGDNFKFDRTYEFCIDDLGCHVLTDSVPLIIMAGEDLKFSYGVCSGWKPIIKFKHLHQVTKAQDNTVYEIDNQPALTFYERFFGQIPDIHENCDISSLYSQFPLEVRGSPNEEDEIYLRTPSNFNIKDGSVSFVGEVPNHSYVKINNAGRKEIIDAAEKAILKAKEKFPGSHIELALLFDCCSRRRILGTRAKEEFKYFKNSNIKKYAGFYGYGEISPLKENGKSFLLSSTLITVLIGR